MMLPLPGKPRITVVKIFWVGFSSPPVKLLGLLFYLCCNMRNRNSFNSYFGVIGSLSFAFLLGCGSIGSHKKSRTSDHLGVVDPTAVSPFRVAFYNLENLFDTVDGPNDDAEFLPGSDNRWNSERYQSKLHNMSKVIDSIAPDILGVVEVENAFVLEDLRGFCGSMLDANEFRSGESAARNSYYEIVHRESPDLRGIDVALLFNRRKFYSKIGRAHV